MSAAILLLGCPEKKAAVVEDAAPPPPPPSAPTVTELAPLIDDGGADADAAAAEAEAPRRRPASVMTANQTKIKACCSAMHAQAKQLGNAPEGYQLNTMASQCDLFVAQLGPLGQAPELSQFRELLKNVKLPSACQF
jgi:hypothetical protein